MERQVVVYEKQIRIIAAYRIHKKVQAILIHERLFLMYQVQINVVKADIHSMVPETPFHIIPEIASLLPHIIIGVNDQDSIIRILTDFAVHAA
jgi:predicted signal transduction protein with EAL and GGDEF domain